MRRAAWLGSRAPAFLVGRFAHSHSASQFLRHLPSHWNSDILPPHCGQTELMIDKMMLVFDSPGSVSRVFIIALLFRDPTSSRGADTGHKQRKCAARVFYALGRSELVGCGVRLGPMAAASLNSEVARAMPMPT